MNRSSKTIRCMQFWPTACPCRECLSLSEKRAYVYCAGAAEGIFAQQPREYCHSIVATKKDASKQDCYHERIAQDERERNTMTSCRFVAPSLPQTQADGEDSRKP